MANNPEPPNNAMAYALLTYDLTVTERDIVDILDDIPLLVAGIINGKKAEALAVDNKAPLWIELYQKLTSEDESGDPNIIDALTAWCARYRIKLAFAPQWFPTYTTEILSQKTISS